MSDLKAQGGEIRFTVTVKRKATGETETFDMVGAATQEQAEQLGAVIHTEQEQPK